MSQQRQKELLDATHGLLDLQIVDRDARPVGKVDDIELDDGGAGRPVVRALLVGGPALADRVGGRLGRWIKSTYRRLHDEKSDRPHRITFDQVRHIDSKVDLTVTRDEVGIGRLDDWLNERLIGRIPGADHAPPQ